MGRERGSCHASLPLSGRLPARHSNFAVFGHESRSAVTRLREDLGAVHTDTQGRIIHPVAGTIYLLLSFVSVCNNMTRLVSSLYSTHPKMAGWRPT